VTWAVERWLKTSVKMNWTMELILIDQMLIGHPLGGELVRSRRNTVVVAGFCWTFWGEGGGVLSCLKKLCLNELVV
jgi:hypothetical protein